jgi:NADH:ubiquinone oxidoreductase subunit
MFSLIEKSFIPLFASKIGEDYLGNSYYISKFSKNYLGKSKRFVVYNSYIQEPTKVDAKWHSWLHYLSDEIPTTTQTSASSLVGEGKDAQNNQKSNAKARLPNLTGTKFSYSPKMNRLNTEKIGIWRPE